VAHLSGYQRATVLAADTIKHGLEIFVRSDIEVIEAKFEPFLDESGDHIRTFALGFAFGAQRGALSVKINIGGLTAQIFTSHFTPLVSNTSVRAQQAQALADLVKASSADIRFVAADLNFSNEFSFSIEGRERDGSMEEWQANAEIYSDFLQASGMMDTFLELNDEDELSFTQDRLRNDLADYSPSTAKEPEQRLDFVFMKTEALECEVVSSSLFFTEPVQQGNEVVMSESRPNHRLFLSDHFGVQSEVICE